MEYRITTIQSYPVTFAYADAMRALRKVRTLQRRLVEFVLTDALGLAVTLAQLETASVRNGERPSA